MLCYVDDSLPGITRKRRGRYWQYFDPRGKRITDRGEIKRLDAIALPPAYEDAWYCPEPDGHIQAVGYDARGRKQYRYHEEFRALREAEKYERLAEFGRALSRLRRRVQAELRRRKLDRNLVTAAVVHLIDSEHLRVGNESYARENRSYGATTLRRRHARVRKGRMTLSYRGKSGIRRRVAIEDRRLGRIIERCRELKGPRLFAYLDEEDRVRTISSADVNEYIRDAMGEDFSAKDFRTWAASVIAFEKMARRARRGRKVTLKSLIEPVAEKLGNTLAISRKSYVHPAVIEAVKKEEYEAGPFPRATKYLSPCERALILFLENLPPRPEEGEERAARPRPASGKAELAAAA